MKKIFFLTTLTLCILISGFSYSQITGNRIFDHEKTIINSPTVPKMDNLTFSSDYITSNDLEGKIIMKTEQDSYKLPVNEMNLLIVNNALHKYHTDTKYVVEFYDGTNWIEILLQFFVADIGINILPDESREFSIYLYPEQHQYLSGKYRITKLISTGDKEFKIFALFTIE